NGSRQQEVGDVDAGDQKDETDETCDQQQRGTDAADNLVLQRMNQERAPAVRIRKTRSEALADCCRDGIGLLDCHPRLQARDAAKRAKGARTGGKVIASEWQEHVM